MVNNRFMKIVVLGGGISSERQVSLVTSISVCKALRSLGHKAIFVDLFLGIKNELGELEELFDAVDGLCDGVDTRYTISEPDPTLELRKLSSRSVIGDNVLELCKLADCVFIGLHGIDGEDGKIQACLELLGVPYTGSGFLGSAMAMDKSVTREIMTTNKIACAPLVTSAPCVVKCSHGGSSIGTYICDTEADLLFALSDVAKYNDDIIIEKKISGIELTVPILDNKALSPIEIIPPASGKFDYDAKYQNGIAGAEEICPARLSADDTIKVQALAEKLHMAMKLSVYSRTDFIMDEDGKFWCLEINTLPGMTPNSLMPKAAKFAGLDYPQLCEKIVELSLKK